ncbi:hypothetical protein J7560_09675 [Wohlfahrtiimonas chitiniclastica]|nr:hypothetical protein [Wohlfahrtiimonas chitiniclastica]MBS7815678.1 hypothetical protein [Wohlfahrtiimonas chitiniclastica]
MSEYQIKLTQAERDTIQKLYDGKAQGNPPNWSHAYTAIAELLEKKLDLDNIYTGNGELRKGEDHPVVVWFRGAAQANNPDSTSVYSVMIREYSEQQMALRGISYSDALMQQASNKVAENAMNDILDRELDQDGFYSFPTIEDISLQDAIGVGQVLFSGLENGDTAKSDGENAYASMNAGWSGTMLFTSLGSDQTWRLFTAGDYLGDNDEYGDRINKVSFNRMDDLKNVLFAYFSMKKAISATILDKDGNFLSGSWDQFKTDAGIGKDTYDISSVGELWDLVWVNFRGVISNVNKDLGILFDKVGAYGLLDLLLAQYPEYNITKGNKTTDDNFLKRVNSFFNSQSANDLQNREIALLPLNLEDFSEEIKNNPNAIYALIKGSPFIVGFSTEELANLIDPKELIVFNTDTNEGSITNRYIDDRLKYINDLIKEPLLKRPGYYEDRATGNNIHNTGQLGD